MRFHDSMVCLLLGASSTAFALSVRSMSFNIRFANDDISIGSLEKFWLPLTCADDGSCRAPGVINAITAADTAASDAGGASAFGLQEVLDEQRSDILQALNSIKGQTWEAVGVGRDDGKSGGEFSPVLFRTDVWNLISDTTKWLSETPDVPSKSFGSGENRIVTIAVLEHKATGKRIIRANCHLDNVSSEARQKGVGIVVDQIKAVQAAQADPKTILPVVLTGDFNSDPSDVAYQEMVNLGFLEDAFNIVPTDKHVGEFDTFTGFDGKSFGRIDFVWLGPIASAPFNATRYEVVSNDRNGFKFSDHRPLLADATLA